MAARFRTDRELSMSSKQPTEHARERFISRGEDAEIRLRHAWEQAFSVNVADDESADTRLHSSTGTLLYARGGKIVTIKTAEYEDWYSPHVSRCSNCDEKYDPIEQSLECPYCSHDNRREIGGIDEG